jgi:hypothetical protein
MSKTLDKYVESGAIETYSDERGLGHGYIIDLPSGKQWMSDPTSHTRGFDTVAEAVDEIRTGVIDYPDDPEMESIEEDNDNGPSM